MSLVKILFKCKSEILPVVAQCGMNLLEVAHKNNVPLTGACEGSLACTTCHVILDKDIYKITKDTLTEREEDLLDSAKSLSATSRLGCQMKLIPEMNNRTIRIPSINKNIGKEIRK
ncbi:hypothetical protein NEOKW01_0782 [Nematocida sp. AWRm80]|nr:hypothetical protein NEOKW01_0782 [Nematocida sp. AWRm80]